MAGSDDDPRWRVFISHTSELRDFPKGTSYVAAVERAISAAGHVIVDMHDFPGAARPPADLCNNRVRGCDVYIGILGTRYGTPVRNKPEISHTEFEFEIATEAGLDRLVFLLDTEADDLGIPASRLIDREFGDRQDAFRDRVRESLTAQSFASPEALQTLVERSLQDLADTRRRISSGLEREQIPAAPQPVQASKFVNPPPAVAPTWFQGRQDETNRLAGYVSDPGIRLVTVSGLGGVGKTAMVCRLLKGLEFGQVPGSDGEKVTVGGIVYLSRNGRHKVEYPTLVADLLRLLPPAEAGRLEQIYRNPEHRPAEMMLALLEAFPVGDPVVVLLDNLESVMDREKESLTEPALHEALSAVLTGPAHALTLIATTRVVPGALLRVEPAAQRQLKLTDGLQPKDARMVFRDLDDDGRLGLRDAADDLLDELCQHTRGFPRALEAVKAILEGDETLAPRDLLDRTRQVPEDQIVQVLVGDAYDLLDGAAQRVMQALSVFPEPVSATGIDFLLRSVDPTTDAAPILGRLVRRQLVRFQDDRYYLHPLDREYARAKIPVGHRGDSRAAFTLTGLQARAADYYAQIRTPRRSWRSLEDVRPQLAEFGLRCDTGDYDTAATVLLDIDFKYLHVWGHYRTLVGLHERIHGRITAPVLNANHLRNLGLCHDSLGEYRRAVELHTQTLAIAREIGHSQGEGVGLGSLGNSHNSLGEYQRAIELHTQALAIFRKIGNRKGEADELGNLGNCRHHLGEDQRAIELLTQALAIFREGGHRQGEGDSLANLGLYRHVLGEYQRAIELQTQALAIYRKTGDRSGEGMSLGNLGLCYYSLGEYQRAIELHTYSLAIARDIGYRYMEASTLGYTGRARLASGDTSQAAVLLAQAVSTADAIGNIQPAVEARSWLACAHLQLGDATAALAVTATELALTYPPGEPARHLLNGLALLELDRLQESGRAFGGALATAEALLALADRNVDALEVRALALSGLALAEGNPARASEAAQAFTQARAVTTAPGVVADTHRLLAIITAHDHSGLLSALNPG